MDPVLSEPESNRKLTLKDKMTDDNQQTHKFKLSLSDFWNLSAEDLMCQACYALYEVLIKLPLIISDVLLNELTKTLLFSVVTNFNR